MFKFQKLLVFDIFRKFTEIGTAVKIPKAYCASIDYSICNNSTPKLKP